MVDEKELVRRSLDGDQSAFDRLYRKHQPRILAALIGRTRNVHDAEDLAQVTFLRAFRALQGFRGEAAFSTWLMQIAINACTTHLRAKKARRSWHDSIGDPGSIHHNTWKPSGAERPDDALIAKERRTLLEAGIQDLPSQYQEAVRLRYVKDRSYAEITRELDVPMGTLKTWLYRARLQLEQNFSQLQSGGDLEPIAPRNASAVQVDPIPYPRYTVSFWTEDSIVCNPIGSHVIAQTP